MFYQRTVQHAKLPSGLKRRSSSNITIFQNGLWIPLWIMTAFVHAVDPWLMWIDTFTSLITFKLCSWSAWRSWYTSVLKTGRCCVAKSGVKDAITSQERSPVLERHCPRHPPVMQVFWTSPQNACRLSRIITWSLLVLGWRHNRNAIPEKALCAAKVNHLVTSSVRVDFLFILCFFAVHRHCYWARNWSKKPRVWLNSFWWQKIDVGHIMETWLLNACFCSFLWPGLAYHFCVDLGPGGSNFGLLEPQRPVYCKSNPITEFSYIYNHQ